MEDIVGSGIDLVLQIGDVEDKAQRLADVIRFVAHPPHTAAVLKWETVGEHFVSRVDLEAGDYRLLDQFVDYLKQVAWKEPHNVRLLVRFAKQRNYQIHRIAGEWIPQTLEDERLGKLELLPRCRWAVLKEWWCRRTEAYPNGYVQVFFRTRIDFAHDTPSHKIHAGFERACQAFGWLCQSEERLRRHIAGQLWPLIARESAEKLALSASELTEKLKLQTVWLNASGTGSIIYKIDYESSRLFAYALYIKFNFKGRYADVVLIPYEEMPNEFADFTSRYEEGKHNSEGVS